MTNSSTNNSNSNSNNMHHHHNRRSRRNGNINHIPNKKAGDIVNKKKQQQQPQLKLEIEEFIPSYLRRFVHPYHGDFCFCRVYHPRLMAQLMSEGFLPIATQDVLLPKLHAHRCVIALNDQTNGGGGGSGRGDDLHISKSTRKKSKRFQMTVNQAFSEVVAGCHEQHGEKCWLYPPLVKVFEAMNQAEHVPALVLSNNNSSNSSSATTQTQVVSPVRLYSIEVWNAETGALAGGELGYTVGSIYTSLTGFAREDSAGSVQLAALGRLLAQLGFSLWDLGMEMDYKKSLGSHLMPRTEFLAHVKNVRHAKGHLRLPASSTRYNAKSIIDETIPELQSSQKMKKETNSPPFVAAAAAVPSNVQLPSNNAIGHRSLSPNIPDPQRSKRLKGFSGYEEEKKMDDNTRSVSGLPRP